MKLKNLATMAFWAAGLAGIANAGGEEGGVEIPAVGENAHITLVYSNPARHLVLAYVYKRDGHYVADFYDTYRHVSLYPNIERELATDNALEKKIVRQENLTLVPTSMTLTLQDGTTVTSSFLSGTICTWPFNTEMVVSSPSGRIEQLLFVKRRMPDVKEYERDCESVAKTAKIKTHYRNVSMFFFPDDGSGFYAKVFESPYLIHFDHAGKSNFFRGRSDIVLVPAGPQEKIFSDASSGGFAAKASQQSFIDKAEDLIADAIRNNRRQG